MTAICFAFLHILLVLVPWGERLRLFWLLRAAEPQCTANHRTDRALAPLASAPPAAASGRSAGSPDAAHSADGSGGSGSPTAAIRRSSVTVNHAREFELHGSDSESDSSDAGGSGSDSDNSDESSCMEDAEGAEVCWTHLGFMKKLQLVELWLIMPLLGDCFIIWSASQQLSFSAVGRLVRKDAVFLGWASALYWVSLVQHLERSPSFYIVIITLKRASPKVSKLLLGVAPLFLAFSTLGMCVGQRVVVVVVVVVVRVWLCGCVVVCVRMCVCVCLWVWLCGGRHFPLDVFGVRRRRYMFGSFADRFSTWPRTFITLFAVVNGGARPRLWFDAAAQPSSLSLPPSLFQTPCGRRSTTCKRPTACGFRCWRTCTCTRLCCCSCTWC